MEQLNSIEEQKAADIVIILSSELIAQVIEAHFNSVLLKQPVTIVDLKPTADGYAFSVAFVPVVAAVQVTKSTIDPPKVTLCEHGDNILACWQCEGLENTSKVHTETVQSALKGIKRARNGKFSKV